jgi:hypothetical protein
MRFVTKLLISLISIAVTVVGSIWAGFETLDGRMDLKVKAGKEEVYHLMSEMEKSHSGALKAQDDKVSVQFVALHGEVVEMRKDVRTLIILERRRVGSGNKVPDEVSFKAGENHVRTSESL